MKDQFRLNLAASLHSTTTDLSDVAHGLADVTADDEIEEQAKTLDRIADDANEAATILRALIVRSQRRSEPVPRRVPLGAANARPVPQAPGGSAS